MHDQRRASRRRLQRVAAQLTADSVVVKHEDGILKNKIKYTGLEENRSGDAAVATQGFGRVSTERSFGSRSSIVARRRITACRREASDQEL